MTGRTAAGALAATLVLTTVLVVVDLGYAPRTGLVRSFYLDRGFVAAPIAQEHTTDISLDFLDEKEGLPRQEFGVEWRGYWYVDETTTVDLYAGADDAVQVLVDSVMVLERNPRVGMRTVSRSVTLTAGSHQILVRYRQDTGGMGLRVLQSVPGGEPVPLPAKALFAEEVDGTAVRAAAAVRWLVPAVTVAWIATAALFVAARRRRTPGAARYRSAAQWTWLDRMGLVAGPALLVPVILFLVGPHTVYAANPAEFVITFVDVVWPSVVAAVAVSWLLLLVPGAVAAILSERAARIYASVLLALGMLLWAQGTLFVADFGSLYGEGLDLSAHDSRIPVESAVWLVVLAGAIVYAPRVSRIAAYLSVVFILLQVGLVAISGAGGETSLNREQAGWSSPPGELYRLSRTRNILHIVMDGFLSEVFGEIVQRDRAIFDSALSGFVFFEDHLGAFPTTRASMPAMMSGVAYRNDEPFEEFDRQVRRHSIAAALAEHGFAVRTISFHRAEHPSTAQSGPHIVRYTIPTPYGHYDEHARFMALQLFDFAAFRSAPQALKRYVYNDNHWLWQDRYPRSGLEGERARRARPSNHAAFLDEFTERLTVDEDLPVYELVHVALPHPPIVLGGDCSFLGQTPLSRQTYAAQSSCGIDILGRLMDKLRALDVYDKSLILLTADHGWRLPRKDHPLAGIETPAGDLQSIALSAMPLLAVKPPGATGGIRVSSAPTAITDIPATIADVAGLPAGSFPGQSVLRLDETASRPRSFAFHTWNDLDWERAYMTELQVFSVTGPIRQPSSWRFERTIIDPRRAPKSP